MSGPPDEGDGGPDDDPMLLSQARSGGADANATPSTTACPLGQPPHSTIPSTSARQRRPSVRFAPGPLPTTDDGHPAPTEARPKGGPPRGARALSRAPWWEQNSEHAQEPLTPSHLRLLAAELGPENAPSITRLKRRAGFLPPLKRVLAHLGPALVDDGGNGGSRADAAATVVAAAASPAKVGRVG